MSGQVKPLHHFFDKPNKEQIMKTKKITAKKTTTRAKATPRA